jgi:hypothetical protein
VRRLAVPLLAAGVLAPAADAATGLTASPSAASGGVPLTVVLAASKGATAYAWRLGDGATARGRVARHVYREPGRFTAVVTATLPDGTRARARVAIRAFGIALGASREVGYAQPLVLRGRVRPAPRAGSRVALVRAGKPFAHTRTRPNGSFSIAVRAVGPGPYAARALRARSRAVAVRVRPVVVARLEGGRTIGDRLRLVASVRPATAGRLHIRVWRSGRRTYEGAHRGEARVALETRNPAAVRARVALRPARGFAAATVSLETDVVAPALDRGATGTSVRALERRLAELGYALQRIDGAYGHDTAEAVLAFQKVAGLPWTGRVGPAVWRALARAREPRARYGGDHIEVDKRRQVLLVVRGGRVDTVVHVSTGATGNTPVGRWTVYRKVAGWDWVLWYPLYFLRGFAIHGYPSVPAYPASHGCVRVPMWIAPTLFAEHPHGGVVYVY